MTLSRVRAFLKRKNIHFSIASISRRLHEAGFFQKELHKKPLLDSGYIQKRLEWYFQVAEIDWNKVTFSDESYFLVKRIKKTYWSRGINRKNFHVVKYPQRIHVWG